MSTLRAMLAFLIVLCVAICFARMKADAFALLALVAWAGLGLTYLPRGSSPGR